jgi:hypothetical protein
MLRLKLPLWRRCRHFASPLTPDPVQAMSNASVMSRDWSFLSLLPFDLADQYRALDSYHFDGAIINSYSMPPTVAKNCSALELSLDKMGGLGGASGNSLLIKQGVSCVKGEMTREANADAVKKRFFCSGKGKVRLPRLTSVVKLQLVLWGQLV